MNKKEKKMCDILDNGEELQMRMKSLSSLPDSWFLKFPPDRYYQYHKKIKEFEGRIVSIDRMLSNGAIIIKESSMAFGSDVFEFIEDSYTLDDDLFKI